MKSMKKIGLMLLVFAFCLSVFAIPGNAQTYQDRNWRNRQNRQVYSQGQVYRNQRNRRISLQEARRLERQKERLYRTRDRYYQNDGQISYREQQRLQKKYYKYRRNVRSDRRDRN